MMDRSKTYVRRELARARKAAGAPAAARSAFVQRASNSDAMDVAYAVVDSPLGKLLAAATKRGLIRLSYGAEDVDAGLQALAGKVSPRIVEAPAKLDDVRRQLDEYFDGARRSFELGIDWSFASGFVQKILRATARIPFGHVSYYGTMAARAGSPRAARAAGNALGSNPMPIVVPCHRVLHAGGTIGGYTGGLERKVFLLTLEGVLDEEHATATGPKRRPPA